MRISASPVELNAASQHDPARIDEVSRQLEGQFAQMLVKSMRDASFGDSLFPGENQTFRDMYDQQLASSLTQGKGLGLAAIIARQLGAGAKADATDPATTSLDPGKAAKAYALVAGRRQAAILPSDSQSPLDQLLDLIAGRQSGAGAQPGDTSSWDSADPGWSDLGGAGDADLHGAVKAATAQLGENTPEGFVASIWHHAQNAARELGVDPRALVAQAALETGWGRKGIARSNGGDSNNLFGIKATGWSGQSVTTGTHEYVDGVRTSQTASFRAYESAEQSFSDYVRLLKSSPRYQQALQAGTNIRSFAQGLQRAGYATDPSYAAKIAAIATGPTIDRALEALGNAAANGVERVFAGGSDALPNPLR